MVNHTNELPLRAILTFGGADCIDGWVSDLLDQVEKRPMGLPGSKARITDARAGTSRLEDIQTPLPSPTLTRTF